MTDCWLIYSRDKNSALHTDEAKPSFEFTPPQDHMVIADPSTGKYHLATKLTDHKPFWIGPETVVSGPFTQEKLVFIETFMGPTDLEAEMKKKNLTAQEIKNVQKAAQKWPRAANTKKGEKMNSDIFPSLDRSKHCYVTCPSSPEVLKTTPHYFAFDLRKEEFVYFTDANNKKPPKAKGTNVHGPFSFKDLIFFETAEKSLVPKKQFEQQLLLKGLLKTGAVTMFLRNQRAQRIAERRTNPALPKTFLTSIGPTLKG